MSFDKNCPGNVSFSRSVPLFSGALTKGLMAALLIAGLLSPAVAANRYIRVGATGTGDGSSWANAYPNFQSVSWARGNTYYLAGGVYNLTSFIYIHPSPSGTSTVLIKKANVADNGSDPGWNVNYANDIAYINGPSPSPFPVLDFANGYIQIDGVTGSGTTGHGIVIYNPHPTDVVLFEPGNGYSISHCELKGAGFTGTTAGYSGMQWTTGKNTYVGYNWIHDVTINGGVFSSVVGTSFSDPGLIWENNVVSETGGCLDADKHGQGMQMGFNSEMAFIIIRNSTFRNAIGSGMIAFLGGGSANHHDIQIYNNIFYITDPVIYNILSPGVIWSHVQAAKSNISIHNNTFYNLNGPVLSGTIVMETPTPSNNVLSNNIWENCRLIGSHLGVTSQTHNGYFNNFLNVPVGTPNQRGGSSSTFNNPAAADFSMKNGGYGHGTGTNLNGVFTTDHSGTVRGGTWDLGALQFGSTAALPPPPATAPSNAQVSILVH